ncbi:hypothetical protein AgCh_014652 [Apium graveolens]
MASSLSFKILFVGLLCTMTCFVALAIDVNPLQDFCVADLNSPVLVNGNVCKDPNNVTEEDFILRGLLTTAADTSNQVGSNVTVVNVTLIPGLNTLSNSLARIDYAPTGINPPHTHPRATEILTVIQGQLRVGFVTSNPNRLITSVLNQGDVVVFPQGLIHFQQNIGEGNAVALSALNSQNPGVITIANAVFGPDPDIDADILARAFQLNRRTVLQLQQRF